MLPNKNNPKCPECGGLTHKLGFIATRSGGRKQRYHCTVCGLGFTEGVIND